jgi:hypothetical protein
MAVEQANPGLFVHRELFAQDHHGGAARDVEKEDALHGHHGVAVLLEGPLFAQRVEKCAPEEPRLFLFPQRGILRRVEAEQGWHPLGRKLVGDAFRVERNLWVHQRALANIRITPEQRQQQKNKREDPQ